MLAALEPGLRLPIADVLYLAMAISDNTAANLLVDRVGVARRERAARALSVSSTTRLRGPHLRRG